MKVTLAGCAFAEVAGHYAWVSVGVLEILNFQGICRACGLRDLGSQGRRDGVLLVTSVSVGGGQICSCRDEEGPYHAWIVLSIVDRHVPALPGIVAIGK